jgi:hypothetical protein
MLADGRGDFLLDLFAQPAVLAADALFSSLATVLVSDVRLICFPTMCSLGHHG